MNADSLTLKFELTLAIYVGLGRTTEEEPIIIHCLKIVSISHMLIQCNTFL